MFAYILVVVLIIILAGISNKVYVVLTEGWCKSQVCLVGKTVIVTGANIGELKCIGYETALDFAKRGAKVILACRNERKAKEAQTSIIEETRNKNVSYKLLNLASFDSVRQFAEEINEEEDRLDVLVNNAGVFEIGDKRTEDGHHLLMQVNYFLLTNLLINLLKRSTPSRVVNVASYAATRAFEFDLSKIDEHALNMQDYYNSKLCNVLFTVELATKLEGTGVTTYSLCPGLVKTNIFHNSLEKAGAQTTLYCALTQAIEKDNGQYFSDCRKYGPFYLMNRDPELPGKLWKTTEDIVNLRKDETQF